MTRLDRIEKGMEALQKSQLRTEKQLAKTDAQLALASAQLIETKRIVSGIGINLGDAAEDFFASTLQEKKKLGNIQFDVVALRLKGHKGKVQDEFDVVMYNGDAVGLVEVKHKVHPSDLENLLRKKLPNFKALFPRYSDARFYLGIAGMSIPGSVEELARETGIALIRQKGEILEMSNDLKAY